MTSMLVKVAEISEATKNRYTKNARISGAIPAGLLGGAKAMHEIGKYRRTMGGAPASAKFKAGLKGAGKTALAAGIGYGIGNLFQRAQQNQVNHVMEKELKARRQDNKK